MSASLFICPLCGHRFDPETITACNSCPLHKNCSMVCCPACGHTTVDTNRSALARWVSSLLTKESQHEKA
jgi:predicted RNA-binding Zn-ribbon protein involved in translation (DUF1610 family)